MKRLLVALMFITGVAYGAPSNTIVTPNTFTANTTIQSSQVNDNYNEVSGKYNAHSHTDITQVGTIVSGTWAGSAVTTQFGGTGEDFSAVASGAVMYFDGTGSLTTLAKGASGAILYLNGLTQELSWLSQGTTGQALVSNGTSANPSWGSLTDTLLGDWTANTSGTIYQATTDGFAVWYQGGNFTTTAFSDTFTPPTTARTGSTNDGNAGSCMPVKKGDYYEVVVGGGGAITVYWMPLG